MVLIMNKLAASEHPLVPVTLGTSTEPSSPAPIHALPDEVMIHIFSGLNAQELTTCSSVCKEWRELSQDNVLWKRLFNSIFPTCNSAGIENFKKAYHDQLALYSNFANGVYASHTLTGHADGVNSLAVADGKLFSGSSDGTIKVWDLETNRCLYTLTGHADGVRSLAVADGKLFSGSSDCTIKVWGDLETNRCLYTLTGHANWVFCLAVADGKLFSGSSDGTIKVWDLETNRCLYTLTGHANWVFCLAVADGKLFSGSYDGTIKVWGDLETNRCLYTLTGHADGVRSLAVADGKLFSGSSDGTIKVWDLETNRCLYTLTGHADGVRSLAVADGKLFSGSSDCTIKVWGDLETNRCLYTLTGHADGVRSLAVADGKLFSGSYDRTIKVWDFKTSNDAIFEEIAGQFQSGVPTAMDRFSRMPAKEKNKVYGELYEILKPFSNEYFGCAEHAFQDQHGLTSTPQQKALAIRNYLLRKTAKLFEGDEYDRKAAMERFMQLPKEVREKIYGELYEILKPFSNDYYGCAEHAFHDQHGQSSTPPQKSEAIYHYLSRGSE